MKNLIKSIISVLLVCAMLFSFASCKEEQPEDTSSVQSDEDINPLLDLNKEVTLIFAAASETWPELEAIFTKFEKKYPNVTIKYEYIESNYIENLGTRLGVMEQKVDIFRTTGLQKKDSDNVEYTYNLISEEAKKYLDLSDTNEGLVNNFKYLDAPDTQYAIPFGGEMRGLYVNKTLLKKFGLEVPKTLEEFTHCCDVLVENGYVPIHGSTGTFAQQFFYPYVCNSIANSANYDEMFNAIENCDEGISEYFRNVYSMLYDFVEKGYYDNEKAKKEYKYEFKGNEGMARDFLDLKPVEGSTEEYVLSEEDEGKIAFITNTQAFEQTLIKTKEDYHSKIEYEFILAPVDEGGGYAYLSPTDGFAINKNSDNIDWALEFLDFFFKAEINKEFAAAEWKIPNTKDAMLAFECPENRACTLGQVTFSYQFYKTIVTLMMAGYDSKTTDDCSGEEDMIGISKMKETKYACSYKTVTKEYIDSNPDGEYYYIGTRIVDEKEVITHALADAEYIAANPDTEYLEKVTGVRYGLDDYMNRLEQEFQKIKTERAK